MTDRLSLDRPIALNGEDRHPHAANQLRAVLGNRVMPPGQSANDALPIRLQLDPSRPEGAFNLTIAGNGITVTGGPFSGVIYGANELAGRIDQTTQSVALAEIDEVPGLPYRTFWNWDHSTNWNMSQVGVQEIGVMNPYAKPPDGFLADFKRTVDYMSLHRIAAITIFGFLRTSHGGIAAAQELCRYATERGVRILPGIAINAYGGVVWEMDHEYNLATWLRKHPELTAQMEHDPGFQLNDLAFPLFFPRGDYSMRGCSSRPENQKWMDEAVAWLCETFEVGGVNIEAGDYGVCGCSLCAARRAEREDASRRHGYAESWSHADMADYYPRLFEIIRTRRPDAWVYSEIQWDNLLDTEAQAPLIGLPEDGIYQHTLNRGYWERVRQEMTAGYAATMPTKNNVFRTQFNCQWNGDHRTERYRLNARDIAAQAQKAAEVGFVGQTMWGEPSAYHPTVDLSYRAFARFNWAPELTWAQFVAEDAGPMFGGPEAAERFVVLTEAFDADPNLRGGDLKAMRSEAMSMAMSTSGEVSDRWIWLAEQIGRRQYDRMTKPEKSPW